MIEIKDLVKEYDGFTAVKGVSFVVPEGGVFAFIGPNGAGKTTTLKVLGAMLKPTSGQVRIMGADVVASPAEVRRLVGWMPDQYGVYADLRVWEYLDFFASAYRVPLEKRRNVVEFVLDLLDLHAKRDATVGSLSRGMTQKLCLGRALLHEPPVLLLDEPASGLDPQARIELRELIKELQAMGKTILVSSHILPELMEYCTGVAIIQNGAIKFSGTMDALRRQTRTGTRRVLVKLAGGDGKKGLEILKSHEKVREATLGADGLDAQVEGDEADLASVLRALVLAGVPVAAFKESELDLGDLFMKITQGEG